MDPLDSLLVRVDALVTTLVMGSGDVQREAVHMLRLFSKLDDEHRCCIGDSGAIPHLVRLLSSRDESIQEDAITCLLNTSIVDRNKGTIVFTKGAVEKIVEVLRNGSRVEARQNAAATLFSILMMDEYRIVIGQNEAVVPGLLQLVMDGVRDGVPQSRKDGMKALFHLSLHPLNKARIVQQGALQFLLEIVHKRVKKLSLDDSRGADNPASDALALITQLAGCEEGVSTLSEQENLSLLVGLLEPGESSRCREHAAAALLMMAQVGGDRVIQQLLKFDACVSALCSLLSAGSQRTKAKAGALLQLLMVNERS